MTAIVYRRSTAGRDFWQEYTILGGVNVDPDAPENSLRGRCPFCSPRNNVMCLIIGEVAPEFGTG